MSGIECAGRSDAWTWLPQRATSAHCSEMADKVDLIITCHYWNRLTVHRCGISCAAILLSPSPLGSVSSLQANAPAKIGWLRPTSQKCRDARTQCFVPASTVHTAFLQSYYGGTHEQVVEGLYIVLRRNLDSHPTQFGGADRKVVSWRSICAQDGWRI